MKSIVQVSESELEIMEIIWNHNNFIMFGELMQDQKVIEKAWKPNTVLTFLSRLLDKELLEIRKQGRLNQYVALVSKQEYLTSVTDSFVDKVYGGDIKNLMTNLIQSNNMSESDLEELKQYWQQGGIK